MLFYTPLFVLTQTHRSKTLKVKPGQEMWTGQLGNVNLNVDDITDKVL